MKLVVGLGNPGPRYANTRHNVGFRSVDELARRWQIAMPRQQFRGRTGSGRVRDEVVLLLEPSTYMNRSGSAVQEAMAFHKVALTDLLVVLDDMALPVGRARLRARGSAGGHNGLADIIERLGSEDFSRLRIGIEQVSGEQMVSHVLSPFTPQEEELVAPAIARAGDVIECWLAEGVESAMNRYNRAEEQTGG